MPGRDQDPAGDTHGGHVVLYQDQHYRRSRLGLQMWPI